MNGIELSNYRNKADNYAVKTYGIYLRDIIGPWSEKAPVTALVELAEDFPEPEQLVDHYAEKYNLTPRGVEW